MKDPKDFENAIIKTPLSSWRVDSVVGALETQL